MRRLAIISIILTLGACASFDGQPRPILEPAANMTSIPQGYDKASALINFYGKENLSKHYRNEVMGIYLAAADERYYAFRGALSRQIKGSGFGLDVVGIGLTSGASFAGEKTANVLSSIATGVAGTRGALSKEIYFEKTLPALLAGIDAARIKVLRVIFVRMQEEGDTYSLTEAFSDIERYAAAASLESAIEMVTAEASEQRAVEQARFDREVLFVSGVPDEGVTEIRYGVRKMLAGALDDTAAIQRAAAAVGVVSGLKVREAIIAINRKFAEETDIEKIRDMVDKIRLALEGN